MAFICFNGQFLPAGQPVFSAAAPVVRYGDGVFETMKLLRGKVLLFSLHCQRLLKGLELLDMAHSFPDCSEIEAWIITLAQKNGCIERARIRWGAYRQEDGLAGFVLEASPLGPEAFCWQEQGWHLDLYTENSKSPGPLGNLKSANYQLYLLAAAAAAKQGADECLVLNAHGHLCDGSRTNVFIYKNGLLKTPALACGGVAGVMRRHLLEFCIATKLPVAEIILTPIDLLEADEIFLTNAIQGIRWVSRFKDREYGHDFSKQLYAQGLAVPYQ
jgi:branched-chain amino acid aminotransferase